jgi:hypothetical protein
MTWIPDLSREAYLTSGDDVRAIGWLDALHPYPRATVPPEFLSRLKEFARRWGASNRDLGWPVFCGIHTCELCDDFHADGNFGVPAGDVLFVAPETVAHYVERHGYAPPAEFIAAVLCAPLPGTKAYAATVERFRRPEAP